jgi:histidine triad (HIT) family protein
MSRECLFCKIVAGELPAQVVAENAEVLVIKDINPRTPFHYLIIPKKHVSDLGDLIPEDRQMAGSLLMMAQELSQQDPRLREFRLVSNNGASVGQVVFHIHLHFLAGKVLS